MRNRKSTLYQMDNAMAELHFAMLQAMDNVSFNNPDQFIVAVNSSMVDIRREFENRYGKFQYPSMAIIRHTDMNIQPHNNINNDILEIHQDNQRIEVRPVTLQYDCMVIDYRKQYIDEYYELAVMNLHKYAPRIDVQCSIGIKEDGEDFLVHNLTSVSYDTTRINIDMIPSYDDKVNNTGQIYVLRIPFTVDTQLLGSYQESKLIKQMIVNYTSMVYGQDFLESDTFSTVPKDINTTEGNK